MKSQSPKTKHDDVVAIELPAPEGWKKKLTPKKSGTPRRNEIVFISPTGEEIKSKRQLDQYVKSHPGGPSTSEFDWGTGDTPRRSARLCGKSKAMESPESEVPTKKQRKSSSKNEAKGEKDDFDGDAEEAKGSADVAMEDAEDIGDHGEGEWVKEEALADKDNEKDTEQKSEAKIEATKMEELENEKTSDGKGEGSETKSMPTPEIKENSKETEKRPLSSEAASSVQGAKIVKEAVPEVADAKGENSKEAEKELEAPAELSGPSEAVPEVADREVEESKNAKVGEDDHQNKETPEKEADAALLENHAASCDGSPHEPKISPVSC